MRKYFDEDERAIDGMECPCKCNCGNWFDLEDGYPKRGSDEVVCEECYENSSFDEEE